MNRSSQNQFINLPSNLAHIRANKTQFSSKRTDHADLPIDFSDLKINLSNTTCQVYPLLQVPSTSNRQNQERQGHKVEDSGLYDDIQDLNKSVQIENELEIPDLISKSHLSLSVQLARVKAMKIEEIKKEFYNENGECLLCGALITRPFKGHTEAHIKKEMTFEAEFRFHPKSNQHPFQIKCKRCPRIFAWTDGEKRLHEHSLACKARQSEPVSKPAEVKLDYDLEALEKKFKGEIGALKKKVMNLEKKLAKTEKKVTGVYKTQGTLKKELEATENRVGGLEEKVETVSKTVEVHENALIALLNKFINQGKDKEITSTSIFDRVNLRKKN